MDFKTRYQYNPKTDLLGRGASFVTYKAADNFLNTTVALKFLKRGNYDTDKLSSAISHAKALEHPNLCRLYGTELLRFENMHGETEEIDVCIFEYMDSGGIKDYVTANPQHLDKLLIDVLQGLAFLHGEGIIHRNLKCANVLVKITEDGPVAKITEHLVEAYVSSTLQKGLVLNVAPERYNSAMYGANGKIGTNLDLWYFGLLVYELLTGERMFGSAAGQRSAEDVINSILNEKFIEDKIRQLPQPYRRIASKCLVVHAGKRVQSADELIALLEQGYSEPLTGRLILPEAAPQKALDFEGRYPYNPETGLLGRGKFASVFKSRDQVLQRIVALKVFSPELCANYDVVAEIGKIVGLEHPNICTYYDAGYVQSYSAGQEICHIAAMEYLDEGNLISQLAATPDMRIKLLAEVLQGLSYLHENGIIHRNLKPKNILIKNTEDGPVAKLTDFGYAKNIVTNDNGAALVMGTFAYMAPEYEPAEMHESGQSGANYDLWCFGVVVYETLTGKRLFADGPEEGTYKHSVYHSNPSQELLDEEIATLPQPYRNVLARCLVKDTGERIQSADALLRILYGEKPEEVEGLRSLVQMQ